MEDEMSYVMIKPEFADNVKVIKKIRKRILKEKLTIIHLCV